MPALKPTSFMGTIAWLGVNLDRADTLENKPVQSINATFDGFEGESRGGITRPSCSRVVSQYPRETEIRNTRQLTIVSVQELADIAEAMGLDAFDPAWIGAGIVVDGIPDLSKLPPSSRLQAAGGATFTIDMENRPCNLPAPVIEAAKPGFGKLFKQAAVEKRGVMAWVERPGLISVGDVLTLHVPDQDPWPHMGAARAS